MAAIPMSVTSGGRRVVLREFRRLYKLTPTPQCPDETYIQILTFPRAVLPVYAMIKSHGPYVITRTQALTLSQQAYWSSVIFHTTYFGKYHEVEEHRWGQGKEVIYERLY